MALDPKQLDFDNKNINRDTFCWILVAKPAIAESMKSSTICESLIWTKIHKMRSWNISLTLWHQLKYLFVYGQTKFSVKLQITLQEHLLQFVTSRSDNPLHSLLRRSLINFDKTSLMQSLMKRLWMILLKVPNAKFAIWFKNPSFE